MIPAAREDLRNRAYEAGLIRARGNGAARPGNATAADLASPSGILAAVDVAELARMQFREREPLLSPWLHSQDLCMIFGARGVGKTHLLLPVALAVATGTRFLSWQAPEARKVLYLDGELPGQVLQRRLLMHCGDREPAPGFLRFFTPDLPCMEGRGLPDLSTYEGQAEIDAMIESDTGLVIVDNLSAWCRRGKENEGESWLPMADWTLSLRRRGIATIIVHHAGKDGQQRGSSKREDLLDISIQLKRPQDYDARQGAAFELSFTKARHLTGDAAQSLEIAMGGDESAATWTYQTLKAATGDRVVAMIKDGLSQAEVAEELQINKSTVSRHVKAAKAAGLL